MLAGMLLSAAIWTSSAEAGRIAYVADYDANVVSQLDTETNAFLSTSFSGMTDTYMLQVSPDGKYLWIPRFTPNKVSVVDLTDGQALPDIDVDQNPVGVVFSPDSSMAYVLSYDASTVQVFDTATRQQIGDDIPVGAAPYYESLSPDGSRLYVANFDDDTISVINTADRQVVGDPVPVCADLYSMAISPDGTRLFIGCAGSGDMVMQLSTDTMEATSFSATLPEDPEYLTISPDGATGWAVIRTLDEVVSFSTATGAAIGDPIPVGHEPYHLAITPDGSKAFTSNYEGTQGITPINITTRVAGTLIPDTGGPWQMAITPDQPPSALIAAPISIVAGQPAKFDAVNSIDPDGTISRYDWNFGDGKSKPDGKVTESHVFTKAGQFSVSLILTDNEGCSTGFVTAGYTAYCNGGAGASTTLNVRVKAPSNNFSFGRIKLNRKRGTASLQVRLPGPGVVKLAGKNVRGARKTVKKAGKSALSVRITGKAKRALSGRGVVKVKAKVTYRPKYGKPRTKTRTVTLRRN